jgi:hypothetical protein
VVMWRPQYPCGHFPHTHACPQLCPAHPPITRFTFFCVWWVLMHPPAPIQTHPHPPESLIPLFVCAHMHVCFPGNFPAIHATLTYPANPFVPLLVLFLCLPVPPYPNAPIQTHLYPYTSVHTYLHPVLHCFYVYLGIPMF